MNNKTRKSFNHNFVLTNHAIEQYCSRTKYGLKFDEAKSFLLNAVNNNIYKIENTKTGEDKWHVPTAECVFISKYENKQNVVVTILSDRNITINNPIEHDLEIFNNCSYKDFDIETKYKILDLIKENKSKTVEKISNNVSTREVVLNNEKLLVLYNKSQKEVNKIEIVK